MFEDVKLFYFAHCDTMICLLGYASAKPMLFASVFPVDTDQLEEMFAAVDRLLLNDASISIAKEYSLSLGSGE